MTDNYLQKKTVEELLEFREAMLRLGYVELAQEAEQELNFRGWYDVPRTCYATHKINTEGQNEKNFTV